MIEKVIKSVEDYIKYVDDYKDTYYFRGQADYNWEMIPSIFRNDTELVNEVDNINMYQSRNDYLAIMQRLLYLQHMGTKTRLCDVTVNPLVALYFAIEDESQDDKDAVVFLIDRGKEFYIDSVELQLILQTIISSNCNMRDIYAQISSTVKGVSYENFINAITRNYLVRYNIELAYSNPRAMLQGGTGILFGFNVNHDCLVRKGDAEENLIIEKIKIPSGVKDSIRRYLRQYGISKEILYDESKKSVKELSYEYDVEVNKKMRFNKVKVTVKVSDILFSEEEIEKIVLTIFNLMKKKYGSTARIYMWLYYDEYDKRHHNWIAFPVPTENFMSIKINYQNVYYKKRMTYMNNEISKKEICETIEKAVPIAVNGFEEFVELHDEFMTGIIDKDQYLCSIKLIREQLSKKAFYAVDIYHGDLKIQSYYEKGTHFVEEVFFLINDMIISIERGDEDTYINYFFESYTKRYEKYYREYLKEKELIKEVMGYTE